MPNEDNIPPPSAPPTSKTRHGGVWLIGLPCLALLSLLACMASTGPSPSTSGLPSSSSSSSLDAPAASSALSAVSGPLAKLARSNRVYAATVRSAATSATNGSINPETAKLIKQSASLVYQSLVNCQLAIGTYLLSNKDSDYIVIQNRMSQLDGALSALGRIYPLVDPDLVAISAQGGN